MAAIAQHEMVTLCINCGVAIDDAETFCLPCEEIYLNQTNAEIADRAQEAEIEMLSMADRYESSDHEEIDEPCSNCGSYAHWSENCKRCEDCKRSNCTHDARCDEISRDLYAPA